MTMTLPCSAVRRRASAVTRVAGLVLSLSLLTGCATLPTDSRILFSRGTVPRAIQKFAWRVIVERCNYESYELEERSFWAAREQVGEADGQTMYSITILSDVTWRKRDPPALIEMTIVDDGGLRLAALKSSFVTCTP
jgi:hypothetical protein